MNMLEQIKGGLVVFCQALPDESLYSSFIMGRMALAARQEGAVGIRAQSKKDIIEIKKVVDLPAIGIVERSYLDSDIYVTVTKKELDELFETGCEMVVTDATLRDCPNEGRLEDLVDYMYEHDVLTMADCLTHEECVNAENIGFDCVSTTLYGHTPYFKNADGPNLELFKKPAKTIRAPVLAESKINMPGDLAVVYEAGTYSAMVGGTTIRPKQITGRLVKALKE